MSVRVLIVDDHDTVRLGIRMVLEADAGIEIVGEAGNGRAAVELARAHRSDVVLMDLRMPVLDGVAATGQITSAQLGRVLVLTTFDDDDYLFGALQAGAYGFLLKSATPAQIITAVHDAAAGRSTLAPEVTARVMHRAMTTTVVPPSIGADLDRLLTERELEVLRLLGRGLSNPQIAGQLLIGETTVKTHVSRLMMKLQVTSRVQAARVAFERWG
ncbi:response regulator transcription factor [Glutamicibacter sp. MNS18]|uniref:response regulator n=1 Tax=Glutamicibacter sp. MNS18 TaxID=2989817 RepID=UPI002236A9EC|nr:response regulator transcription factor [Glutamicibacter sp. MNS18]MCW4465036.1 response regulator transcription factor [Glutamicibacter sp. MNS18]